MPIDRKEVKRIASLARLKLGPEGEEKLAGELASIVSYIDKLNELDVSNVEPLAFGASGVSVFRADEPVAPSPAEDMLSNAPDRKHSYYRVPRVIE